MKVYLRWKQALAITSMALCFSLRFSLRAESPTEKPDVLLAVSGSWELKSVPATSSNPWGSSLERVAHYEKSENHDQIDIYRMKNKFDHLELSVFNFETLNLDQCFFLQNYSLKIPSIDPSISENSRHRMVPVC